MNKRHALKELVKDKVIKMRGRREESFTLSSRKRSHYYYNMKRVTLDPYGSNLLADIMLQMVSKIRS